jgi:hypothetical protein
MSIVPKEWARSDRATPEILSQASAVLAREASRFQETFTPAPLREQQAPGAAGIAKAGADLANRVCPVTGAMVPVGGASREQLGQQAHELVASLLSGLSQGNGYGVPPSLAMPGAGNVWPQVQSAGSPFQSMTGMKCPVTGVTAPVPGFDLDRVRRQAHEFIETLLITFNDATGEKGLPAEDQVPLIRCEAPVTAGSAARATLRVANEESTASDVTLYCTNFVADSGYEIPSMRVNVSPRRATIQPGTDVSFEITIAVLQQTPAGIYSGLVQAMGSKYVKAVLSVEVL